MRAGFRVPETRGMWSFAPKAKLVIEMLQSQELSVTPLLIAHATPLNPVPSTDGWNGSEIGRLVLLTKDFTFSERLALPVPAEAVRFGLNNLEFVCGHHRHVSPFSLALGPGFAAAIIRPRPQNLVVLGCVCPLRTIDGVGKWGKSNAQVGG
ncbi:MAG: hypothetical protein N2111_05380 [Candidatus Sumerlaeaceae bacterium]|nr:hypothetical protein [Candidatus Sumerlaeaceae bacterium]